MQRENKQKWHQRKYRNVKAWRRYNQPGNGNQPAIKSYRRRNGSVSMALAGMYVQPYAMKASKSNESRIMYQLSESQ
jgi:hypothetical protein